MSSISDTADGAHQCGPNCSTCFVGAVPKQQAKKAKKQGKK